MIDFILETYEKVLEAALKSDYRFLSFDEIVGNQQSRSCLLRHDIDSELLHIDAMLEIERNLGVQATYFVMTRSTAYNLFCVEALQQIERILRDGHRIGLHFMGELCEDDDSVQLAEKVLHEVQWLEAEFDTNISSVSFHQPNKLILKGDFKVKGLVNTYNKEQMSPYFYVSDTNMHWHQEHPYEIFRNCIYPHIQLLIHPMWWTKSRLDTQGKWLKVLSRNRQSVVSHWKKRERSLENIKL